MSVRDDIMAMACNPMKSYDDGEFARYRIGFHHAKNKAVEIAEASEKKLLGRVKIWKRQAERLEEEKDSLIAELRELSRKCTCDGDKPWDILDKYEEKP